MGRSVLLAVNPGKPAAVASMDALAALIERHGTLLGRVDVISCAVDDRARRAELLVVLGGDGTLLAAARCFLGTGVPLLGVNAGRVGFMAAYDMTSIEVAAERVFGGGALTIDEHPTLRGAVVPADADTEEPATCAVNEFVITAGPPFRLIELRLMIDGRPGPLVRGDGLIVSTPTGSTAYNVSAGGPIVMPGVSGVVVTPIAAHSLSFRPIVVPSGATIEVLVERSNDEDGTGTTLVADGQPVRRLREGDRLGVRGDGPTVPLVADPIHGYWPTLMTKMGWAIPPGGA